MPKRIPRDKPIGALRSLAASLGWSPLRIYQRHLPDAVKLPDPKIVTWYESGKADGLRTDLFLQIDEYPIGATGTYVAGVYAVRYRIFTGWHGFRLTADLKCDDAERERLDAWLHHRWFDSLIARRQFRANHPECVGYSWKRIRDKGPRYHI